MKGNNSLDAIRKMSTPDAYQKMLSDIRSWGWSLAVFGIIHLVAGHSLSLSHGLLLISVGALSFLVRESPMYVLFASVLAWAAISNFTGSNSPGWMLFGFFQVLISVQVFQRFFLFKKIEKDYNESLVMDPPEPASYRPKRTDQIFPTVSIVAGIGGLLGTLFGLGMIFVLSAAQNVYLAKIAAAVTDVAMIVAVLGFSLGLASLLSKAPRRQLSIVGTVAGGLAILIDIGLIVLVRVLG